MLNIQKLSDLQKSGNQTLNILVYGESGTGKTTIASTFAKNNQILYIDAEAGTGFIKEEYAKNIDIIRLKTPSDLDESLKEENIKNYKVIVLDSIGEILKKLGDNIKGNKDTLSLNDWGILITKMEGYFRKFRDLNKHCVLVALSQDVEDEGMILKRPLISGKSLPQTICGYMDEVLFLESDKTGKRTAYCQPSPKFFAKDRSGKLPFKLEGEQLDLEWIAKQCITPATPASPEMRKEIFEGFKKIGLDIKTIHDVLLQYNTTKETMDVNVYNQLKERIEQKLKLIK